MKIAIAEMIQLQGQLNTLINPNWKAAKYNWADAIWIESAELMDQLGYKWWKKPLVDHKQVHLEVIDILHFGISCELSREDDEKSLVDMMYKGLSLVKPEPSYLVDFKNPIHVEIALMHARTIATHALKTASFDCEMFGNLMVATGLSFEQLKKTYLSKNILNIFRQQNGYQDGSYQKIWNGKEDNEVLAHWMTIYDSSSPTYTTDLFTALSKEYKQLIG